MVGGGQAVARVFSNFAPLKLRAVPGAASVAAGTRLAGGAAASSPSCCRRSARWRWRCHGAREPRAALAASAAASPTSRAKMFAMKD
jgi:hypothetical protein